MRENIVQLGSFLKSHFKNRVRTKKFLIWVVITPMLLIGFLNLIGGEDDISVGVAVLDRDDSNISKITVSLIRSEDRLDVYEVEDLQEGVDMLKYGEVEALLVIPEDFSERWSAIRNRDEDYEPITFDLYHTSGEHQDLIDTLLKGITADINEFILGDEMKKAVELVNRPLKLRDREASFSDLLLPGGIMIVLLQSGFFAASDNASAITEAMLDKRLKISPVSAIYSMTGMVLMDSLFTTFSGFIALLIGLLLFEITISLVSLLGVTLIIFLSSLIFSYLGCSIGKISSDRASTQGLSSMVIFPLIFFSQAYIFSILFPDYIIAISRWLPIYPAAEIMKRSLFYSIHASHYFLMIGHSLIWLLVAFVIFLYLYKD